MSKPVPVAICPQCDYMGWKFDIDQAGMCIECLRAKAATLKP
jgi:hypothetical protein